MVCLVAQCLVVVVALLVLLVVVEDLGPSLENVVQSMRGVRKPKETKKSQTVKNFFLKKKPIVYWNNRRNWSCDTLEGFRIILGD